MSNITHNLSRRAIIHYFAAFVGLSIYGGQVCPMLATLSIFSWSQILLVVTLCGFILHAVLSSILTGSKELVLLSRKVLITELIIFLLMGTGCAFFNLKYLGFPIPSGAKVILGYITFGFFAAIDLALEVEYRTAVKLEMKGMDIDPEIHFFSLPKKFILFAILSVTLTIGIVCLLVLRDMGIIFADIQTCTYASCTRDLFFELAVVLTSILLMIVNTALSYSRNLKYFFEKQTLSLIEVGEGNYNRCVPV
ncbi:MAG: hypothetical protein ACYTFY_19450, partial [Planctomycetota bacterium]